MKIGLVGWGVETQSIYRYMGPIHDYVIYSEEQRSDFPVGKNVRIQALSAIRQVGLTGNAADLTYLNGITDNDLIALTPVSKKNFERLFGHDSVMWAKTTTALQLFFENSPTNQIIGVTGTKGKGTTTTLIYKMIAAAGLDAHIGGNIGLSPLDFIDQLTPKSWVILEMSSFQLYKFPYSPHIAVHLMMLPEHLVEWHIEMSDYIEAKRSIIKHQKEDDITVYLPTNDHSRINASHSRGKKVPYTAHPGAHVDSNGYISIQNTPIINTRDIQLIGAHNIENICAAVTAVWHVHQDVDAIRQVLSSFSGLEHRLEFVRELHGVKYYDDSFGTTPDTSIVAMDAIEGQKIMIVGGHDKGNNYSDMAVRLAQPDVRHVVFVGTTAPKIYDLAITAGFDALKATIKPDKNNWTMKEIVAVAQNHAQDGDAVLLSTGSASFGIFSDYKERGKQFKDCVQALD